MEILDCFVFFLPSSSSQVADDRPEATLERKFGGMHTPLSVKELNKRELSIFSRLGYTRKMTQTGTNVKLPLSNQVTDKNGLASHLAHK